METLKYVAKSAVAGVAAAIAFAIPVVDDGILPSEALGIAGAFLAGAGVTYVLPNQPRNQADVHAYADRLTEDVEGRA